MAIKGIAFRATAGFVTNAADDTYCLGEAYPTTRGGITFGFDVNNSANTRDRNPAAGYERLAGLAFGANRVFTVDLPAAGAYDLYLGIGDAGSSGSVNMDIRDNTTTLFNITGAYTNGYFYDASGALMTDTGWKSTASAHGTKRTVTLATTKLVLAYVATGFVISYLGWEAAAPTAQLTGGITLDNIAASGSLASIPSSLTGGITLDDIVASGSLGQAPGVLVTTAFKNWSGAVLANAVIPKVAVLRVSDMALVYSATNVSTDASGIMTITNIALFPGTQYLLVTCNAGGTAFGCAPFTAS